MSRHFVIVRTRETAAADREHGFRVQGFESPAYVLEPSDKLALYVGKPVSGFIATMEVTGARYVSTERIWTVRDDPSKIFPFRYPTTPRVTATEGVAVPFRSLIDELEFSAKLRNRRLWGMLFIRAIRNLSPSDFALIEARLRDLSGSASLSSD